MSRAPVRFGNKEESLDPVKIELCLAIDRAIARKGWTYTAAAIQMGTSRANISRVVNKKIDKLTLNQLFGYLSRVCPEFRFMLCIDASLHSGRPQRIQWLGYA